MPDLTIISRDDREILDRLLEMEDSLASLPKFRRYMAASGHADFTHEHEKHHQVMATALSRLASGEIKRLMILAPPGSAKSTIGLQFSLWWFAKFPHHHILRCSATQSLAEKFGRRCRAAVQTKEFELISGAKLDNTNQAVANFANTLGGSITSAGVGTSIVGLRSNLNLLDDPVSSFEAVSSGAQRQNALDWFRTEYRSRLIPGAPEVIISTVWHSQDIPSSLMNSEEADTWTVIRIPMVAEDDEDILGRKIGQRLWPEWFTDQMVTEQQRDPLTWAAMYQQRPLVSAGDWLSPRDLPIVDHIPKGCARYAAMDIALSEGRGDFSVIVVAAYAPDGILYIEHVWRDRVSPEQIISNLSMLSSAFDFRTTLLDDDPASKVFRDLAHKIFREQGRPIPLTAMPLRGKDKETRAAAFQGLAKIQGVKLLAAPWNGALLREVMEFPFGKNDDIIDALSLLGRKVATMSSDSPEPDVRRFLPVETQINVDMAGVMTTHETMNEMWDERHRITLRRNRSRI